MGTEVMRPQNCLVERIRSPTATTTVFLPRRRTNNYNYYYYVNSNPNNNPAFVNKHNFTPRPNRKQPAKSDHQRRPQPRYSDAVAMSSSSCSSSSSSSSPTALVAPVTVGFSRRSSSAGDVKLSKDRNAGGGDHLVMEKVTMLRRGESLDARFKGTKKESGEGLIVVAIGTNGLGPDNPGMAPEQIRMVSPAGGKPDVLYAGSAFAVSPSPSSLPLPSFSKKKSKSVSVDDSATRDLRRLLRLDL